MMESPAPQLQLFGSPCWQQAGARHDVPDSLPGYLIVYLAYRGDWLTREALTGLLWPERSEAEALHNLRANLHRARGLLVAWQLGDALQAERRRVRLSLPNDVAAFRRSLGGGDWHAATRLHRAPLLAALSFRGFGLLDAWARCEREALADAWRAAAMKSALAAERGGDASAASDVLLNLLQGSDPTEDAVQALLRVAPAAGRRDEALAAYERLCTHLHEELGLAPTAATLELAHAARAPAQPQVTQRAAATLPATVVVPRALDQPPRLVGRARERDALADPARRWVALGGEPGVGKTRLLEEACPAARWIACREGLEPVAFAPVIDYLRDHAEALPDLGERRRDLARLLPELGCGELLPPADSLAAKPRLLDALAEVLEHGAPVLVFDDLQWADAATRELVLHLARRAAVRLRLAYRSDETTPALEALFDALDAAGALQRILLPPLSPEAVRELMADLTRSAGGPPKFSAWLHRRTGGNPFFALQTLRALFESGRLHAHVDGWSSDLDTISVDYSELDVPPRVADLVRRRLSGLADTTRRVLAVVAVLGSARDIERIASATGLSPWAAAEAIAEAQAAGLLGDARFAHDVIRHGVIQATPEPLQRVLHASVARLFDTVLPAAEIASHWWAAGDAARAVEAALRAAEHDRHAGLPERAIELLERSLARQPAAEDQARLHAGLARLWLAGNDSVRAEAAARQVLREPALPRERAIAYALIAALRMKQGQLREAQAALDEAWVSDPDELTVLIERSKLAQLEGRVSDLVVELERQRDLLRRRRPGAELVGVLTSLGAAYDELGKAERGLPLHEEAWRLAERIGARYAQVEVAINLLWSLSALGRDADAVAIAEQALTLGEYDASATLRNNLAWALAELGRIDAARGLYEQLAAGADPTLGLIARARLIDLQGQAGLADGLHRGVQCVLDSMPSTEVYMARAAAALPVLRYGDDAQVRGVLAFLRPQPLDPWLADKLSQALRARGIDPGPYLPAA